MRIKNKSDLTSSEGIGVCTDAKMHGLLKGTKILRHYGSKTYRLRVEKAVMRLSSQAAKRADRCMDAKKHERRGGFVEKCFGENHTFSPMVKEGGTECRMMGKLFSPLEAGEAGFPVERYSTTLFSPLEGERIASRADLRTDGARRSPDSEKIERLQQSCKSETFRAWSKSKTGRNDDAKAAALQNQLTRATKQIQGLSMLINTINIDRLRVKPAMTERFPSLKGEMEDISCAERTVKNFSPFTSHFSREGKRVAFTLAEVLITLGIIGVVAAITLPSVIAKYQQKEGLVRYKKMLSMLNQAASKTVTDFGYVPECYAWAAGTSPYPAMFTCLSYDSKGECTKYGDADGNPRPSDYHGRFGECSTFNSAFFKNLKVIRQCNQAYYDGCTAAYKGKDTILKENNDSLTDDELYVQTAGDSSMRAESLKKAKAYVFADGSIIIYSYGDWYGTWPVIDVNGKRGPNKWGYDVFRLTRAGAPSRGIYYTYNINMPLEKGGVTSQEAFLK